MERHIQSIPDPSEHPWQYKWVALKWRAGLAVSTHPVMVALIIALAVVSVPVIQLLSVNGDIRGAQSGQRESQVRLDKQQAQITGLVTEIQRDRAKTAVSFCHTLNRNQAQAAKLTLYLKALVISGARQGRVFEPLYRKYGFPPYRVRLRMAIRQAKKIASFSPAPLNCRQVQDNIERDTPPPPNVNPAIPRRGNP